MYIASENGVSSTKCTHHINSSLGLSTVGGIQEMGNLAAVVEGRLDVQGRAVLEADIVDAVPAADKEPADLAVDMGPAVQVADIRVVGKPCMDCRDCNSQASVQVDNPEADNLDTELASLCQGHMGWLPVLAVRRWESTMGVLLQQVDLQMEL